MGIILVFTDIILDYCNYYIVILMNEVTSFFYINRHEIRQVK